MPLCLSLAGIEFFLFWGWGENTPESCPEWYLTWAWKYELNYMLFIILLPYSTPITPHQPHHIHHAQHRTKLGELLLRESIPCLYDWIVMLTYAQLRTHICMHLMVRLTESSMFCAMFFSLLRYMVIGPIAIKYNALVCVFIAVDWKIISATEGNLWVSHFHGIVLAHAIENCSVLRK